MMITIMFFYSAHTWMKWDETIPIAPLLGVRDEFMPHTSNKNCHEWKRLQIMYLINLRYIF